MSRAANVLAALADAGYIERKPDSAHEFHWSDCAVHNEPAYPNGPCDCGNMGVAIMNQLDQEDGICNP